jgi:regulator of protease activity HflC (stomatin/prohibitin superfamily)
LAAAEKGQNEETIELLNEYKAAIVQLQKSREEVEQLQQQLSQAVREESIEHIRVLLPKLEAQEEPDQDRIDQLKEYKDAFEQLEKDKKTVAQLQRIVDSGQTVGDGHDQCYVDIAKLAAAKAPAPWAATKGSVVVNLRDVFMTNEFEELFNIEGEAEDLKAKIDKRKIAEIEKFILNKVKESKIGDGIVLKFVDINEVHFPVSLHKKLRKVSEARLDEQAALFEARAKTIRARAEAQKKILEGRGEGESRAAFFRELLRELKREDVLQGEALVRAVLELIGRMVSAQDLQSFVRSARLRKQLESELEETNGSEVH